MNKTLTKLTVKISGITDAVESHWKSTKKRLDKLGKRLKGVEDSLSSLVKAVETAESRRGETANTDTAARRIHSLSTKKRRARLGDNDKVAESNEHAGDAVPFDSDEELQLKRNIAKFKVLCPQNARCSENKHHSGSLKA